MLLKTKNRGLAGRPPKGLRPVRQGLQFPLDGVADFRRGRFDPWAHIALSNLKRFLLGTHHKPQAKHLNRYVAKFNYRFHRRWQERSLFHRLARACLSTITITTNDLVAQPELV